MKLYDFICENEEKVVTLVKYKVIPDNIEQNIVAYRTYLEYRQTCRRTQAIENTAWDIKQSDRNTLRIIQKMEQEV